MEESPYKFAAGKFAADANGVALEPYEYDRPFCTTDEVLVYWNVCYTPMYIPEEGMRSMPYQQEVEQFTGVQVEYLAPAAETKQEAFSVMIAADDLPDLMAHGLTYYGKSANDAISEGWFANIYDYREYAPNYFFQADNYTQRVHDTIYYSDDQVVWFYGILKNPTPATGLCMRGDWLDKLGVNPDDLDTFDEIHDVLLRFKSELEVQWPMEVFYTIELNPAYMFSGYNTAVWLNPYGLPSVRQIDGKVQFSLTQDNDDLPAITMLQQWYSEALIDPGWPAYIGNDQMAPMMANGDTGYVCMNPSQIPDYEATTGDPDAKWVALVRPLCEEGQKLKYGQELSYMTYGNTTLSASCENLPLAVTWCDWFFSPFGSEYSSWGPEGIVWEYNEEGNKQLTDFVLNNPDGIAKAWLLLMYAGNNLGDATLFDQTLSYSYPGGEEILAQAQKWVIPDYQGEYDMPSGFRLSDEESEEVSTYSGDLTTYLVETYAAFFTGDKPLSEWDAYQADLSGIGLDQVTAIYQNAYDAFMAENG